MNQFIALQQQFEQQKITKSDYIEKMYSVHKYLFDYIQLLQRSAISNIEINTSDIVMTMSKSGLKIAVTEQDHRTAPIEALNFGDYEKAESDITCQLVKNADVIFDIGANIGWYSLLLAKTYPSLEIHAFEPLPQTYDALQKNIFLNNLSNIKAHPFGFSDQEQDSTFYFYPEGSGNASLADLANRDSTQHINCHVKKLDDYIATHQVKIDFIKCDVEGAELLVFKGGLETIKQQKPIVFAEMLRKWSKRFQYHPNEIINLFKAIGYQCYTLVDNKLKSFDEMDENTTETNFFFLHTEKHTDKIQQFSYS